MLKEKTLLATATLTDGLEDAGIALDVLSGTPLEVLTAACYAPEEDMTNIGNGTAHESALSTVTSGANFNKGNNEHSLSMDEIVNLGASTVGVMMHHARNVLLPMYKDVLSRALSHFEDMRTGAVKLNIVMKYPEKLLTNQVLIDMIERYENHFDSMPLIRANMYPELDHVQLMEVIKTGVDRVDEDLQEYFEAKGDGYLKRHYDAKFLLQGFSDDTVIDPVVTFLVARKFMDETPESNVDLTTFNHVTTALMASAGKELFKKHKVSVSRNSRDILFERISRSLEDPEPTVVNGEVYKRWLNDGGSPEIIMGMVVSGDHDLSYSNLLAQKEMYIKRYQKACQLAQVRMDADKVAQMLKSLLKAMHEVIKEGDDSFVTNPQEQREALAKFIESSTMTARTDYPKFVRAAVYEVFYKHTDSLRVVKEIDAAMEANKELSPREASTMVFIDLVAGWLCSQIKLEF